MQAIRIYITMNTKHTTQCDLHTHDAQTSRMHSILKHIPQVFCLNVIRDKVSTPMYVYLLQGAQAGEDCGRQRG
jgi:hypothetical protein